MQKTRLLLLDSSMARCQEEIGNFEESLVRSQVHTGHLPSYLLNCVCCPNVV